MGVSKVRVAVVGAGPLAREHLRAFKDVPGVELSGICSRTLSKAEALAEEFGIPVVTTSIDDLAERSGADLAIIAVTIPSTLDVSMQCFNHPWMTLIEKPLGVNLEEAEKLAAEAKRKNRVSFVAFNRRYYASTNWVKDGLDQIDGRRFIKIQDQEDVNVASQDGHAESVLKNWMFANSIHLIDMFCYLGRSPVKKVTPMRSWRGADDKELIEHLVSIEYENGDTALYEGIWNAQGPWAVTVTTPDKRYEMKPIESASYQYSIDRTVHAMNSDELDSKYKPGFYRQAVDAVNAVKGEKHNLVDLDEALITTRLTQSLFGL